MKNVPKMFMVKNKFDPFFGFLPISPIQRHMEIDGA